jgi:serine/threonine protein kinase/WD40 repeat protein
MGEVWLATEVRLGRKVALKVLPADLTRDPLRVQRFEQEARAASALNHPNVCTIHALGQTGDGQHYIAMEYVEGETLRHRLSTSRLTIRESVDIAIQVAAALSAAHAASITHRDIKPENVMLRPDGFVKVLDFGLAKLAPAVPDLAGADTTPTVLKTEAGMVVGTTTYMSPEQARGQEVDGRTDIWSLGVLLYEMVAGRSPFAGPSGTDVLAAILERDPAPLARLEPDTPSELERIVRKALRKDRNQRYQSAGDLLLDFQAFRDDLQVQVRFGSGSTNQAALPATTRESTQAAAPFQRRGRWVLAAAAAVLALGVLGGLWLWRTSRIAESPGAAPSAPVPRNLTRLTFGAGLQTDVSFSPDGRFIAYASNRAGNFDIWVQPVAGGDAVQITKSLADETQPDWSPDGSLVAYRSERDGGGLFTVPPLGGPEIRVSTFGYRPRWAPDASLPPRLLFTTSEITDYIAVVPKLYVVGTDGTLPNEVIRDFMKRMRACGAWGWASDRNHVFVAGIQGSGIAPALYVVTLGSGKIQRFTSASTPLSWWGGLALGRQSGSVFLEASLNGVRNLWRARLNPERGELVDFTRLTTGPGADVRAAINSDGTRIAFTTRTDVTRVWNHSLDHRAKEIAPSTPLTPPDVNVSAFAMSPNGQTLAYSAVPAGSEQWESRIQRLDTPNAWDVFARDAYRREPFVWSRDGAWLGYGRARLIDRSAGKFEASLVRLSVSAGSQEEVLVTRQDGAIRPYDWSADGTQMLAVYGTPTGGQIVRCPVSSSTCEPIVADKRFSLWRPRLSPNGKWLALVAVPMVQGQAEAGSCQVGIAPGEGGPVTMLTPRGEWSDTPAWSPDGTRLYFSSNRGNGIMNIWALPFDPKAGTVGPPVEVTTFDGRARSMPVIEGADLFVRQRGLLLPLTEFTGSIWILDSVDK